MEYKKSFYQLQSLQNFISITFSICWYFLMREEQFCGQAVYQQLVTAFLKFTQLIVGWVALCWHFRGIYKANAADNALGYHGIIAVAQGISRQLSHSPKAVSSPGWTSPTSLEVLQPWLSWWHPLISLQLNIFLELGWGTKLSTLFQLWSNKCQVKRNNDFHWHPTSALWAQPRM